MGNEAGWRLGTILTAGLTLGLLTPGIEAADIFSVGGVAAGEATDTDDASRLLSRNEGEPALGGTLKVWAAARLRPQWQLVGLGSLERDPGMEETELELEEGYVRFASRGSSAWVVQAGRITPIIGSFARRRLAHRNPLIGSPDAYAVSYPLGITAEARYRRLDYRFGVMDDPLWNAAYVPDPASALRPVAGVGVTPRIGFRLGAAYTRGPYLNGNLASMLPPGASWKDYEQEVLTFELEYSRGHLELHGEAAFSSYEVPGRGRDLGGDASYLDLKYTFAPRIYAALRLEKNDYPYIEPMGPGSWLGVTANFYDAEVGMGYRLSRDLLVKVSYRRDHWTVEGPMESFFPDGHALAVQLSYHFDARAWFRRSL